jgi:hypothetical protein
MMTGFSVAKPVFDDKYLQQTRREHSFPMPSVMVEDNDAMTDEDELVQCSKVNGLNVLSTDHL